MRLLVTGGDQDLGGLLARALQGGHELLLTGLGDAPHESAAGIEYRSADLRQPEDVLTLLDGVDAVVHAAVVVTESAASEKDRLDHAARGTYVLNCESRGAGLDRIVLISTLRVVDRHPEKYVINENWRPKPAADAESLAPYMAEMVTREFVREPGFRAVCLRLGTIGETDGTTEDQAVRGVEAALSLSFEETRHRWKLYHLSTSDRFPCKLELDGEEG